MKILHVIPTLNPGAGGPPLIATRLACAQAVLGHEVHMMAYQAREKAQAQILAENEKTPGFDQLQIHHLPFITNRERVLGSHAKKMAKQVVPGMDAVHIHGIWEPELWHAAREARKNHKPYLVLLNGMLFPWAMRRGRVKKMVAMNLGAREMLEHCIFHFGNVDEELAVRALGFTRPGYVVPNGIVSSDLEIEPAPDAFRKRHPQLGQEPFALFLGRLHEQKGIDLLIDAFAKVVQKKPEAKLVIAGPDYGRLSEVKGQIDRLQLQGKALLVGPIFGGEKVAALKEAACFCLLSRHEGFSLAVLEAMAVGTPVVISPECHFPEVLHAGAGLIAMLDPQRIAEAILRMFDDVPFREGAGRAAQALVLSKYTWPQIASQTVSIYKLCASNS